MSISRNRSAFVDTVRRKGTGSDKLTIGMEIFTSEKFNDYL